MIKKRIGIAAKILPHSSAVDITDWSLEAVEEYKRSLQRSICEAAGEALTIAIKEYGVYASFAHEWRSDDEDRQSDGMGGPMPADPSTIYVTLPLGEDEFSGPTWSFSLSEVVDNLISWSDHSISKEAIGAKQIRDSLRELAQRIDDALEEVTDEEAEQAVAGT